MRVLIVYPKFFIYGGAELVIVKLANYLTKKGIQNAILTTAMLPEVEKDLPGTEVIVQKPPKIPFNLLGFKDILALHKGISDNLNNFDLINVHNYPAEISLFPHHKAAVWMCNEPPEIVLRLELEPSPFLKLVKKAVLKFDKFVVKNYIKNVIVADEFNAKRFEKLYGFKPEIINYGIDYEFFSQGNPEKVRKKYDLNNNFIILQAGILTPLKNQMESLKTIEKLRDKIPHLKLILAGLAEKEYKLRLEKYIQEKNLEKYLIFTGQLNREETRDFYHTCDVLLHPIKSQGGWLAPFETLCAKKPIVVSPEMSASEIIKREKIGIVSDDYAEVIMDIYRNKNKYLEMAERGRQWVKNNLNWDIFCQKNLEVFQKALESK
jgi:glycosyltransferase involved in cell wall biosynthesis